MSRLPWASMSSSMQRSASLKLPMFFTGAVDGWTATVANSGLVWHAASVSDATTLTTQESSRIPEALGKSIAQNVTAPSPGGGLYTSPLVVDIRVESARSS